MKLAKKLITLSKATPKGSPFSLVLAEIAAEVEVLGKTNAALKREKILTEALLKRYKVQIDSPEMVEEAYAAFTAQLKKEGWSSCDARYIPSEKKAIKAGLATVKERLGL